jgi:type I pantothenate kinase
VAHDGAERRSVVIIGESKAVAPAVVDFSPYRVFTREAWARLREDTPMTLVPRDLEQMSGLIEDLSMEEVEQIYLPISRLINLHVLAIQELFGDRQTKHHPHQSIW